MAIDKNKVKKFWDERAKKTKINEATTFETKQRDLKEKLEEEIVSRYMLFDKKKRLLDMGCGWGKWSFRFASKFKEIWAVDFCKELIRQAKLKKQELKINNIKFVVGKMENFNYDRSFDVIFFSGVIQYLNDEEAEKVIMNLKGMTNEKTQIVVREPSGLNERYEVVDQYSEELKTYYSSIYRTKEEFEQLFSKIGFKLFRYQNMFPEGCELNKWKETRLMIYDFRRK